MPDERKPDLAWEENDLQILHLPYRNLAQYAEGDVDMPEPEPYRPPSLDDQEETIEKGARALGEYLGTMAVKLGLQVRKSIAVDFDGTLAEKTEPFAPDKVGPAIPEMVERVRELLAQGEEVKIFTARVSSSNPPGDVELARRAIEQFCEENFDGKRLEVTAEKDPSMELIIDDRSENPTDVVEKIDVGEVNVWGGYIVLRTKKETGKWPDYKRLGKQGDWKLGDPLPEHAKAALPEEWKDKYTMGKKKEQPKEEPKPPAAAKEPEPKPQPKTKLPDPPESPKEAGSWMKEHLGWDLTLYPANEHIGPMLAKFGRGYVEEFPFLKGFLAAIGDTAETTAKLGHQEHASGGTLAAVHYGPQFQGIGLSINFKNYGSDQGKWEKALAGGVKDGFHPQGTATLKATIDHEMGHVLTKALHERDPEIKKLWESVGGKEKGSASQSKCRAALSAYAATNIGEFIAEGWSEYRNNPNPRPMAKAIGDRMVEQLRKKYPEEKA